MTQLAIIGIIVENKESGEVFPQLLHDYAEDSIGRMGLPLSQKKV